MRKWTVAFLLPLALCVGAYAQTLGVMTFNVRYPSPDDGPNVWENRRDILVETIRLKNPDLFGTQELFHKQGQYIADKLPEYTWFGISRRGNNQDEHMGVFYKPSKLRLLESGNFWLSESPDTPGSMSWDVSLPRMVTWGLFEISETGRRFYFYNTHFPHRREDAAARVECAKVIAKRMRTLPEDLPFLMTGGFQRAGRRGRIQDPCPATEGRLGRGTSEIGTGDDLQPLAWQHGRTPHRLDPLPRQHQDVGGRDRNPQSGWPLPLGPLPGLRNAGDTVGPSSCTASCS